MPKFVTQLSIAKVFLLAVLCLLSFSLFGQHYERDHVTLVFGAGANPRAITNTTFGNVGISTKPAFGLHFGGTYTFNINKNMGIKIGTNIGLRSINYQLQLNADKYGLLNDVDEHFSSVTNAVIGVPILFVYRLPLSAKHTLAMDVGGGLKFYRSGYFQRTFSEDTIFGTDDLLIDLYIEAGVDGPIVTFDVHLFPHWQLLLKNHRILQIGLQASISVTPSPYTGDYSLLTRNPAWSYGTYDIRNSWFGVELGYVFTRVPNPKRNKDKPQKRKVVNFDIN